MRKLTFCICENKGADQPSFISATWIVQFLYFLNAKFPASFPMFCDCTARFWSDLFENHIVVFFMTNSFTLDELFIFTLIKTFKMTV